MSFHLVTVSYNIENFISVSLFISMHLSSMSIYLEREIYFKELAQIAEAGKFKIYRLATQRRTDIAKPSAGSTPSSSGKVSLFSIKTFN